MSTVLFVGLGAMGRPMAENVARAGHDVVVADVDTERERVCAAEIGARPLAGFQDATPGVDIVITMLPTSAVVADALLGADSRVRGLLAPGVVVVDMSSSQPLETAALAERLTALGVRTVDAPVSGGVQGATDGTLTVMVGGPPDAVETVTPVLRSMSARLFHTGALGSGHAMKALNNFVAASGFVAACEALLVAQAYGLDDDQVLEILNHSTGRNFSTSVVLPRAVVTGTFQTGFPLALLTKDVGIARDLARGLGLDPALCARVHEQLTAALAALPEGADHSAAFRAWGRHGTEVDGA